MALLLIIRLRGDPDTPPEVRSTLKLLRLHKKYHAVIYPDTDSLRGMLDVIKDWVTWGEVDREVLKELILRRGRLVGNRRISPDDIKKLFKVDSIDELVDSLINCKILWHKVDGIKPIFRLHPPKGGFKRSIRKPFKSGGELGYRGSEINNLVMRMI